MSDLFPYEIAILRIPLSRSAFIAWYETVPRPGLPIFVAIEYMIPSLITSFQGTLVADFFVSIRKCWTSFMTSSGVI